MKYKIHYKSTLETDYKTLKPILWEDADITLEVSGSYKTRNYLNKDRLTEE